MTAKATTLFCGECLNPLAHDQFNADAAVPCVHCSRPTRMIVFPAHFRPAREGRQPSMASSSQGDAVCFFHETKPAVVACDACGRFLCKLCDMEWSSTHLCSSCLSATRKQKQLNRYTSKYPRYDRIAFGLAFYGVVLAPFTLFLSTLISAPAAIYTSLRHWREPLSIVPCSRWKMIVATAFAGVQLIAWAILVYLLVVKVFTAW